MLCGQTAPRRFELKMESPRFYDLIDRGATIEKVAGGFGFTEGPVWDERGFVYVGDERKNRISKVYPDGRVEVFLNVGDPDGSTFDRRRRLITCSSAVLRAVLEIKPDATYRILADKFEGKKFNSPNDVVLGPDGALYFTDPTLDLPKDQQQEIPFQGIYRLADDGSLRLLAKDMDQPNGLAFSPDGKLLYVDDSRRREIRVYDFAGGQLTNGRLFGKEEGPRGSGGPDGMRVDANGNLFATGPEGVWVWDPQGHHLGTIVVPEQPANLAWGGADYRTLYLTAQTSVYRIETKTRGFVPK